MKEIISNSIQIRQIKDNFEFMVFKTLEGFKYDEQKLKNKMPQIRKIFLANAIAMQSSHFGSAWPARMSSARAIASSKSIAFCSWLCSTSSVSTGVKPA